MSWANTAYVKKLKATPGGTPISKSEKLLLFVLADYYDEGTGEAWVSLTRLAEESLQTQAGVIRILRGLELKHMLPSIREPAVPRTAQAAPRRTHGCMVSRRGRQEIGRPGAIVTEAAEPVADNLVGCGV